jgi:RNA polymerase sigma-70 factor (ECF subfamily)
VTTAYNIQRAQNGDNQAFEELFCAVQPALLRYLRVLVGDDAEDVASETWLCIVRDLSTFTGDDLAFRGWAATIARHRAVDHLRYRQRRPLAATPVEDMAELLVGGDTETMALDTISTSTAVRLIASLPQNQAEAVMLRAVLGLDAKSAGRVLGKRPGAVRTAAYRGLRRLAEVMAARKAAPRQSATSASSSGNDARVTHLAGATVKEAR